MWEFSFDNEYSHMFPLVLLACSVGAVSVLAETLPGIFGHEGAVSPLPANKARYLLDLAAQGVYLHYYGDEQIFLLALSPKLKQRLEIVASEPTSPHMPTVYGVDALSGGTCDWSKIPWSTSSSGADAEHVFYGREIRQALKTQYGNAIHLSLGPGEDPEGWTDEEMEENFKFWQAIHKDGESVGDADGLRQFRDDIASKIGGTFKERWGSAVTTKAHRFALQMYTAESQSEARNAGGRFFEMFPGGRPPTDQVVFFEAEDGCKGTPTPKAAAVLYEYE